MSNHSNADIITYLSAQEETIAALYAEFSVALPEHKSFWSDLVLQEKAHGKVLRQLVELCESNDVYFNSSKFNVEAIKTNVESINKEITKVSSQGITAVRAYALAVDIEHSLIEANYFRIIESDIPDIKLEIQAIESHTRQHVSLVEEGLQKAKASNPVTE